MLLWHSRQELSLQRVQLSERIFSSATTIVMPSLGKLEHSGNTEKLSWRYDKFIMRGALVRDWTCQDHCGGKEVWHVTSQARASPVTTWPEKSFSLKPLSLNTVCLVYFQKYVQNVGCYIIFLDYFSVWLDYVCCGLHAFFSTFDIVHTLAGQHYTVSSFCGILFLLKGESASHFSTNWGFGHGLASSWKSTRFRPPLLRTSFPTSCLPYSKQSFVLK